jgi:porphobilinogen synthase
MMSDLCLTSRPRRLRRTAALRRVVAETRLTPQMLMMPYFVVPGRGRREPIPAMPGVDRLSVDLLVPQIEADVRAGGRAFLLFGVVDVPDRDRTGKVAAQADSLVCLALRALRQALGPAVLLCTDVCLCGYTDHGHCGVLDAAGYVDNDATLPRLAAMSLCHAQAGADLVAPSDMMDGRVGAIRQVLDQNGYSALGIMAYSAKYASAYYGPFREAAASAPAQGDRRSYQMDCRNRREALREVALDVDEGADILMVKPALAYLDIIAAVRAATQLPIACYNVSGEYSMVKAAAAHGWIDERAVVLENFYGMARAGADILISYHTAEALKNHWLDDVG